MTSRQFDRWKLVVAFTLAEDQNAQKKDEAQRQKSYFVIRRLSN